MGEVNDSWIEIVGKSMGRPPEERMPRLRDSISWGTLEWQGLKAEKVLVMPIMGRDTGYLVVRRYQEWQCLRVIDRR